MIDCRRPYNDVNDFVVSFIRLPGKTRPRTGVVFRDSENVAMAMQSGVVTYELVAPDGSPVLLSFYAPWVSDIENEIMCH